MENLSVVHIRAFEAVPTGGNPCAVVFNGNRLNPEQMRSLAEKFHQETAFVLPPTSDADIRLRYFVPKHEMEMCVHATIGTVTVLSQQGQLQKSPLMIETPLGVIRADWILQTGNQLEILLEQFIPTFSDRHPSKQEVAHALGISETTIVDSQSPIQAVSTSRSKLMIPVQDWQTLDAIAPDFETLWNLCDQYQTTGFYPFTLKTRDSQFDAEARQFPKRVGYNEDAATGVAACALGAYLTRYCSSDGEREFTIGQGSAMGKPSRIIAKTQVQNGKIIRIQVGGSAVIVGRESLTL